jgi:hypothetical protein
MSITIQLAPKAIFTHRAAKTFTVESGELKRKSISRLRYKTGIDATIDDKNIIMEKVIKNPFSIFPTSIPPMSGTE